MFLVRLIRAILDNAWLALKPALRFVAWLFALIATVALVNDVTLWQIAGGTFAPHSIASHWIGFSPGSFDVFAEQMSQGTGWFWASVLMPLLGTPVWVLFGFIALILAWLTRYRERTRIFAN